MDLDNDAIASRLRQIRYALGLEARGGQKKLAEMLGLESMGTYNKWEQGSALPLEIAVKLMRMPDLRGLTLDWIYLGDDRHLTVEVAVRLRVVERLGAAPDREKEEPPRGRREPLSDEEAAALFEPLPPRKPSSRKRKQ